MSWAQPQARQLPVVSGVTLLLTFSPLLYFFFVVVVVFLIRNISWGIQLKKKICSLKFPDCRLSDSGNVLEQCL